MRSQSPGEVLPDLSSVPNSLVSATDAAKVQSEGLGNLYEVHVKVPASSSTEFSSYLLGDQTPIAVSRALWY